MHLETARTLVMAAAMNHNSPSDEQLAATLEYFADRLGRIFAYFLCILEFEDDPDLTEDPTKTFRAWSLYTIQNACMESTLIAIRDLDDILSLRSDKKQNRKDDLRVSDFGFPSGARFLSTTERDDINKLIAHSTTAGIGLPQKRWHIWDLTSRTVAQSLAFLTWIEDHYTPSHFLSFTSSVATRTYTTRIFDYIQSEVAKNRINEEA